MVWQGQTFGYLEDKMYCKVEGEQITLYIKQEAAAHKCSLYVKVIEQLAKEKYDEIMLVLDYINQKEDVLYRQEIFEVKKQEFLKLIRQKDTILTMIENFEYKFFVKYQELLREELVPYVQTLQQVQQELDATHLITPYKEKDYIIYKQVTQQITIVQSVLNATTLDEIINQIPAYLYLKQALR
jgi:hypothetical protein